MEATQVLTADNVLRMIETVVAARLAAPEPEWPPQGEWTYADFARLPDDGWRYEVIKGELYMSPPPVEIHQRVSHELDYALTHFVKMHKLGRVYTAPFGVILPDIATPVQPDLVFVSNARRGIITEQGVEGVPDLVVEILSPSNWRVDRREKFQAYQEAGVPEYWIVDPGRRTVEVFVLQEGVYTQTGKWGIGETARSTILAGFEVAVDDLFVGRDFIIF